MPNGFNIPREQLEAGWEAEEDRLSKLDLERNARAFVLLKDISDCYFLRRNEGMLEIMRKIDRFLKGDEDPPLGMEAAIAERLAPETSAAPGDKK